jgi:hypothetical protein
MRCGSPSERPRIAPASAAQPVDAVGRVGLPNQLGVDYNAHAVESILRYLAPDLDWREASFARPDPSFVAILARQLQIVLYVFASAHVYLLKLCTPEDPSSVRPGRFRPRRSWLPC